MSDYKPLYLYAGELPIAKAIAPDVIDGWTIEEIFPPKDCADTAERMRLRLMTVEFHDEALQGFMDKVAEITSEEQWEELMTNYDFSAVAEIEWQRLLIAFGPYGLSAIIEAMLPRITAPEELDQVAALSEVRKMLDEARISSFSTHE